MQCLLCSARGGEVAILAIRGKGVLEEKGAECCQRSLESWGYNDGNRVVTEFWMEGEGRKRLRGEVRIPSPVHRPTPPHPPRFLPSTLQLHASRNSHWHSTWVTGHPLLTAWHRTTSAFTGRGSCSFGGGFTTTISSSRRICGSIRAT
jgi:hypothetical protein